MTNELALGLNKGERIELKLGKVFVPAIVDRIMTDSWGRTSIMCRRCGITSNGKRYPLTWRLAHMARICLDQPTSNIFADWLEERGELKAAAMLRQAFPFVDANGVTSVPPSFLPPVS